MNHDPDKPAATDPVAAAVETAREPMLLLDEKFRVTWANAAFREHFRAGEDVLRGRSVYELEGGRWNVPGLRELLESLRPGAVVRDVEVALGAARGREQRLAFNARRFADPDRTLLAVQARGRRRVSRGSLPAREALLGTFIEQAPSALAMFDRDMRYLHVSRRWRSDYGLGDRELKGLSHYEIFPEIPAAWREAHRRGLAGETLASPGDRFERLDGSVQWVRWELRPWYDSRREIGGIIIFTEDITDRRQAEEALRQSEEKFRAVFEQAAIGMGRVNFADARWIDVNDTLCRMLGYSRAEMLATPWPEITLAEDVDRDLIPFRRMAAGELERYSVEKRFLHKQGHPVWTRLTLSLVRDARGRPDYEIAAVEDISVRRLAEQTLREAKTAAEEASRAKSQFLANMSHEIRTPMTIFLMALEHLLQVDQDPRRRHLLEVADRSARTLRELTDNLLDMSRIEAHAVEFLSEPFDLAGCVKAAVEMFALPARERGLELTVDLAADLPAIVLGDAVRLKQILVNLVGNAVKFTQHGRVTVTVRTRGDDLEFTVADTGIGIPADKRHLLFRSFSQVDASFTRRYSGSGLGLAICRGLVEQMGGEISVTSEEGRGSTFVFTLPLRTVRQPSVPEAEERRPAAARWTGAPRILLADDEPLIRQMIRLVLEQEGCRVEEVATGREAVAKWASGRYDLVLMDLQMPAMDGLEATRAIREREPGAEGHTAIVGLTGHVRPEIRKQCLAAGMDRVLAKPVPIDDLQAVVEEFCGR